MPLITEMMVGGRAAEVADRAASIARLRHQLSERFPAVQSKPGGVLPTGMPIVDGAEGGLRRAAVTEFAGTTGAGTLFLRAMRRAVW